MTPQEDHPILFSLRTLILRQTENNDEIVELLNMLRNTDWSACREHLEQLDQKAEAEYQDELRPCARCEQLFPRKHLTRVQGWDRRIYCTRCVQYIWEYHCFTCLVCGKLFVSKTKPREGMDCCTRGDYNHCGHEYTIVDQQNTRARKRREPATLTLKDWIATLEYFSYACAYCRGSYDVCEHFSHLEWESAQQGRIAFLLVIPAT